MQAGLAMVTKRVARLRRDVASSAPTEELLAHVEDVLTEGYARALAADAWSMRTEQRLHELISDSVDPLRGPDLRELASEHGRLQRQLIALRRELAELWRERNRLCGGSHAESA